jgi:hypothetical protein
MNFKEYALNETSKLPSVGDVKKFISTLKLEILRPEAFEVEQKSTDAGMGGYDYIFVSFDDKRIKDKEDIKTVVTALEKKYNTHFSKENMVVILPA